MEACYSVVVWVDPYEMGEDMVAFVDELQEAMEEFARVARFLSLHEWEITWRSVADRNEDPEQDDVMHFHIDGYKEFESPAEIAEELAKLDEPKGIQFVLSIDGVTQHLRGRLVKPEAEVIQELNEIRRQSREE